MNDDSNNDDVGYRKPPKKHQFKKGQSGCPDGGHAQRKANKAARAQKQADQQREKERRLDDLVRTIAHEEHTVRSSTGVQRMSKLEITMRNILDRAMKADANERQVRLALKLYDGAKLLKPPSKNRPMVLVVPAVMEPKDWAKATEGELLSRNPLEGIPGAEGLLSAPPRRASIDEEND